MSLLPPRLRRFLPFALLAGLIGCGGGPSVDPPPGPGDAILEERVADLLATLLEAARRNPDDSAARGALAMAYDANGLSEPARVAYDQAIALAPDEPRWWYHSALAAADAGDFPAATARLDSSIVRDPDYGPSYWRRGQYQYSQGDFDAAEASFREAMRRQPKHPAGAVGLARVHLQRDEPREAVALLESTRADLHRAQFLPYIHYLLGTAYRALGELDRAREELALGRRGRPLWRDIRRMEIDEYRVSTLARTQDTSILLETGRAEEAVAILEELRGIAPQDRGVLATLARAYHLAGRAEDARRTLENQLAIFPDDEIAARNLSAVHVALGRIPDALRYAELAVELNPHLPAGYVQLGQVLERAGRPEAALDAYRGAVARDPGDPGSRLAAGSLAASLGLDEEAKEHYRRVLDVEPQNTQARSALDRLGGTRP